MEARSLDVIAPEGQQVTLAGGRTITAKPITLGQLPRFVKAIRPAFGALVALVPASSSPEAGGQGADPEGALDPVELLAAYADHGEAINEAVCIVTGEPREVIDALNLEDALKVLTAVWEVNKDFFAHRVLPLLAR